MTSMDKHGIIFFCGVVVFFTGVIDVKGMKNNCVISLIDPKLTSNVERLNTEGAKVIYVDFKFQNISGPLHGEYETSMYNPLSWVLTFGRHGRSLLLLRPQYEILSLWSLSFGTERLNATIMQEPTNCLTSFNATEVSYRLGEFLLSGFKTPNNNTMIKEDTIYQKAHICHFNIANRRGKAAFYYICCNKTTQGETKCYPLKPDRYFTILFICIFFMNILAVMFSPLLIPSKLYAKKYETTSYEHQLKRPLTISIRKMSTKPKAGDIAFPISYFEEMDHFNQTIQDLPSDVTYNITLSKIDIVVGSDRLLRSNRVPVGLFESLYSALVKCEVGKRNSIKDCCKSNILGPCKPAGCSIPWFRLLRRIMRVVMYLVIGIVWIFRLYFYIQHEDTERREKEGAARQRNLSLSYTGNLTWYLTPIHVIFLVCYSIFVLDVALFGILSKQVKMTLRRVLRKCLRDMTEISKTTAIGWSVQILLLPFKRWGVFGLLIAWLYYIPAIPVVVATLAFYCLPTVNILIRLFIYFIAYLLPYGRNCLTVRCCKRIRELGQIIHRVFRMDILTEKESIERPGRISVKNRFLQLIVIFLCLITILSFSLLAMECIVFLIEILMYTFIGVIVNASHALRYITLAFLLGFYARDCFSTVNTEYLTFNQFLNDYFVNKMREKVENITRMHHDVQQNTAFQVSLEDQSGDDDKPISLLIDDEKLKWNIYRMILFLDKNDTPNITSKFFFDTCYMEHAGVPGPLLSSLLRAMQRFLVICVFLFFVVIVILAFGEEYGISATNQMFATLAGGFLPFMLRFVLFKTPEPVKIDPAGLSLSFKSKFKQKIEDHHQSWKIADIRIISKSIKSENEIQNDSVYVTDDDKSKDKDIMLEEIDPMIISKCTENVDILIYDTSTDQRNANIP